MRYFLFLIIFNISFVGYALKPDRSYLAHPDSLGLNVKIHQIKSTDNAMLHSWVLHPMGELNLNTSIILAYGDAGNMSYWLNHGAILSQLGYTVVLFDYRGFGKSSDFNMNLDQLYYDEFSEDLNSVYNWVKNNIDNEKVGVWGLSMGTIMAGFLIENNQPDFLLLEGLVVNPSLVKKNIYKIKKKKITIPKSSKKLNELYKSSEIPMLIFSGKLDQITISKIAKEFSELAANRQFVEFDGDHLQGFNTMTVNYFGDQYVKEIDLFMETAAIYKK